MMHIEVGNQSLPLVMSSRPTAHANETKAHALETKKIVRGKCPKLNPARHRNVKAAVIIDTPSASLVSTSEIEGILMSSTFSVYPG